MGFSVSEDFTPISALLGGLTLGLSATLYLLFAGRITGMSGFIDGVVTLDRQTLHWKCVYVVRVGIMDCPCVPMSRFPELCLCDTRWR